MWQRAAASRYNRQLAKSLPTYISRWALFASIALVLTETAPTTLVPIFAVLLTISLCALMQMAAIWMMFKRWAD